MGLIKRDYLEDKGTLLIERNASDHPRAARTAPKPAASLRLPVADIPQAKSEAQKIVEKALQDARAIREAATETGKREGREEASVRLEEALATLESGGQRAKNHRQGREGELLRLSLKIAEQIIRWNLPPSRRFSSIVSEAISRVSDREQIIVRAATQANLSPRSRHRQQISVAAVHASRNFLRSLPRRSGRALARSKSHPQSQQASPCTARYHLHAMPPRGKCRN